MLMLIIDKRKKLLLIKRLASVFLNSLNSLNIIHPMFNQCNSNESGSSSKSSLTVNLSATTETHIRKWLPLDSVPLVQSENYTDP